MHRQQLDKLISMLQKATRLSLLLDQFDEQLKIMEPQIEELIKDSSAIDEIINLDEMKKIFKDTTESHKRYGSPRIKAELNKKGLLISLKTTAKIMCRRGLKSIVKNAI